MLLCSSQSAECGIVEDAKIVKFVVDLLDREYWDGDWEIASEHGTPVKDIYKTKNSWAWIDIVGFENESVINNTRYVNGTPRSFAIVRYDSGYSVPNNHVFVSYDVELKVVDTDWDYKNDTTEAILHTKFVHKEWICYIIPDFGKFCYWQYYTEGITTSCTVDSPETFTTRIPDVHVHIISMCNRSVNPVTYIYIPTENHSSMENVMISRVCYNDSNIARYDQTGWVMKNQKGTEHVEFVDDGSLPSWAKDDNQSTIDHCGRLVTVFGRDFNMSLLNISLHTPYETRYVTNYMINEIEGAAKVNVPMLKIILLVAGFIVAFILVIGVIKRRI
jgi:hypothetical protein